MQQIITTQDLQRLLTVGVFIKDGTEDAYQFTEDMLTINDRPVCGYEVIQEGNSFYLKLKSKAATREPLKIDIVDSSYPVVIRFTEREKEIH